jgi:tetratricopeptide (TPR) repeat protein
MMKWLLYLVLIGLMAGSWVWFSNTGKEAKELQAQIDQIEDMGDPDGKASEMKSDLSGLEGERTFSGILLTFVSAGVVGIFFVVYLLPFFAQRVTHAVYDSAEMVEKDVMHDARSLMAQGDYHGAIEAFKQASAADPLNRLPWVEIAKIYKDNLQDPASAIQTIRHALESQEWEINDAAFFLFRLAEMYDSIESNRASARAIMQQVIDEFPGTRHSANAKTKLHEWDVQDAEAARLAEEQGYLAAAAGTAEPAAQAPAESSNAPMRYELPPADDDSEDRPA